LKATVPRDESVVITSLLTQVPDTLQKLHFAT
jgi:hypothetical protein